MTKRREVMDLLVTTALFKEHGVNKRCKLVADYWKKKVDSSWL